MLVCRQSLNLFHAAMRCFVHIMHYHCQLGPPPTWGNPGATRGFRFHFFSKVPWLESNSPPQGLNYYGFVVCTLVNTAHAHGQSPNLPLVRSNTPFPGSLKSIESLLNLVTRPMGEGSRLTLISALGRGFTEKFPEIS